jgi:DNA polymerase-3 subunit alpha
VRKRIPIGPGPGAAAGSYIAFLLGLSETDPLRHDLHFRAATAVCGMRREIRLEVGHRGCAELIRVVKSSRRCAVAHVAILARRRGGALVREVGGVLDLTAAEIGMVEELLVSHGSSAAALESSTGFQHGNVASARLREAVEVCSRLEGLPYHAFPRAGSLLALPRLPASSLVLEPAGTNQIMVQLTERDAEALGWLHLELDGVRHLSILSDASTWVSKRAMLVTPASIPLDDEATFRKLGHSDTSCLVHLESPLAQHVLSLVKPARLSDLADVLALCAQARAGFDQTQAFAARRSGWVPAPTGPHDVVGTTHDVLRTTHGLILYHEQLFELALQVAGMDAPAAQAWVHALSGGDRTRIGRLQRDFIVRALDRGAGLAEVEALLAQAARSQPLASRAHCLSMALATYRAAYLLVHHRREFMFSLLRNSEGQHQRQGHVQRLLEVSEPSAPRPTSGRRTRGEPAKRGQLQLAFGPGVPRDPAEAAGGAGTPSRVGGRSGVWIAGRIRRRA